MPVSEVVPALALALVLVPALALALVLVPALALVLVLVLVPVLAEHNLA